MPKNEKTFLLLHHQTVCLLIFSLANDFSLGYEKRLLFTSKAFNIVVDKENDSLNRLNLFKVARYYNIKQLERILINRKLSCPTQKVPR
jgi:hypothetical protein